MLFSSSSPCPFGFQVIFVLCFSSLWYFRSAETVLNVEDMESNKKKQAGGVGSNPIRNIGGVWVGGEGFPKGVARSSSQTSNQSCLEGWEMPGKELGLD